MSEASELLNLLFKPHPWHGVSPGGEGGVFTAYIELTPTDTVKYEIDKPTGHLKVDRPQKYSNACPTLYGFIPQTYCGAKVGEPHGLMGDGDPIDICVISEKHFPHGDILVPAIPIGGLRMVERNEADDKIIAVMKDDASYGSWRDLGDMPAGLLDRLRHYFLTYKDLPDAAPRRVEIPQTYGRAEALAVIGRSFEDYRAKFGTVEDRLRHLRSLLKS